MKIYTVVEMAGDDKMDVYTTSATSLRAMKAYATKHSYYDGCDIVVADHKGNILSKKVDGRWHDAG